MDYENFLAKLNGGDMRSYFLFETFILKLIEHDASPVSLIAPYRAPLPFVPNRFDAVINGEYRNLPGPIAIEIKLDASRSKPFSKLLNTFVQVYDAASKSGMKSFLFICGGIKLLPAQRKEFENVDNGPDRLTVLVWDDEDINKLIDKDRPYSDNLISNLAIVNITTSEQGPRGSYNSQRLAGQISKLRQAYDNNELTLVLGAGVSRGAGMADWNALLDALLISAIDQKLTDGNSKIPQSDLSFISDQYRKLENGTSPLLFARYIRKSLEQSLISHPEYFMQTVTDTLYSSRNKDKGDTSELLQEIAKMCIPRRGGSSVRAVITYNFDDLLEHHLEKNNTEYHSIFREGETPSKHELPIYHVHGFLPRERTKYTGLDKSLLVFSEEGYHRVFYEQYHWSNLIQIHHMIESTCLMIGLSLTDPNIRRLLEISAKHYEMPRHYALMRRISIDLFIAKADPTLSYSREGVEKFLIIHHNIQENLLKELGVSVIWFDEYSEIPNIVNKVASLQKPSMDSSATKHTKS